MRLGGGAVGGDCPDGAIYLVSGPSSAGAALRDVCAESARTQVADALLVGTLYRCTRLARAQVDEPTFGPVPPAELVALRRLVA
jgi:hypothetical protein